MTASEGPGCPNGPEEEGIDFVKLRRGEYEKERLPDDFTPERCVPDFGYNILSQRGCLYEPVADRAALADGATRPEWPDGEFAVCLTHDVDFVSARSVRHAVRDTVRTARLQATNNDPGTRRPEMRVGPAEALKTVGRGAGRILQSLIADEDPLHCYERWLDVEAAVGATSTFFFMPDRVARPHGTDNAYRYGDRVRFDGSRMTVAEMISNIDARGWEVGLHPTWYTYDDAADLRRQRRDLDRVTSGPVRSVRQHYLHYDVRRTPGVHEEAGFEFDSTLGFNDNVGFRFGTAWPWQIHDHDCGEPTSVLEVPLTVQDGALFGRNALDLDSDLAFEYLRDLTDAIRSVGGVLTLSWHPSRVTNDRRFSFYRRALEYLDGEGAWFGTVAEVGDHWRAHRK